MMEKMQLGFGLKTIARPAADPAPAEAPGWRSGLPTLANQAVTLRELRISDAQSLFAMLSAQEVRRFISPPPTEVRGFERFIEWALAERAAGRYMCFAVVPAGYDMPIGIMQARQLDPTFSTAEWGAALGSQFWGTGLFKAGAELLIDFLFEVVGVHRLEARAAVQNGRANGAARKLGAVQEGVLRRGLWCRGEYHDQLMWSILAEDWRASRADVKVIVH